MPHELMFNGPPDAKATIVLAHGAGAPMDSGFMNFVAEALAERAFRVVRFEFPYMAQRRTLGKSRLPDREPVLRKTWLDVVGSLEGETLIIGGKSMGGRIASLVADEADVAGLVCLGYPFHPPGKPDQLRTEHLRAINTTTLILQGERDPFGTKEDVAGYTLSPQIHVEWLPDGDHSFKPRKSSGHTEQGNWLLAVDKVAAFAEGLA